MSVEIVKLPFTTEQGSKCLATTALETRDGRIYIVCFVCNKIKKTTEVSFIECETPDQREWVHQVLPPEGAY